MLNLINTDNMTNTGFSFATIRKQPLSKKLPCVNILFYDRCFSQGFEQIKTCKSDAQIQSKAPRQPATALRHGVHDPFLHSLVTLTSAPWPSCGMGLKKSEPFEMLGTGIPLGFESATFIISCRWDCKLMVYYTQPSSHTYQGKKWSLHFALLLFMD